MNTLPLASRRHFLRNAACGFGGLALNAMLTDLAMASSKSRALPQPQHQAKAKRVIFLFMAGGPSQHDLFDYKERLAKTHGQRLGLPSNPMPFPVGTEKFLTLGPMAKFAPRGQSGVIISDLLPHLHVVADDICLLRGMQADNPAHDLASLQFHTGSLTDVRPSMGAWISFGLGSENHNLPSYISIQPGNDVRTYGSAFLPAAHQGTVINSVPTDAKTPAIRFLNDPTTTPELQRRQMDLVQSMNQRLLGRVKQDAQMEGMIQSFELAFRMQAETPKLVDLSHESKATQDLYGIGQKPTDKAGRACLLARRLSEAGVRFVQVTLDGWDHHGDLRGALPNTAAMADQPCAALIKDLKARGLLEDTLVIWSGEFGRTPWSQDLSGTAPIEKHGREHQPESFCTWLAGGGIKGGLTYGETDEFGYRVVDGHVHIHDLHATILHLLGINHERLTYRFAGRDFRLTDIYGEVVKEIMV